jgi:hypothetical protein
MTTRILTKLVEVLYERNDLDFRRGTFRCAATRSPSTYESVGASSFGATKWKS